MTAYRAAVLEHFRHPRNRGPLADANAMAEGANPLCGDRIRVELCIEGDAIREARFTADACALCIASASVLTSQITGMAAADAAQVEVRSIHEALDGEPPTARMKCAALPLDTLRRALRARSTGATE